MNLTDVDVSAVLRSMNRRPQCRVERPCEGPRGPVCEAPREGPCEGPVREGHAGGPGGRQDLESLLARLAHEAATQAAEQTKAALPAVLRRVLEQQAKQIGTERVVLHLDANALNEP